MSKYINYVFEGPFEGIYSFYVESLWVVGLKVVRILTKDPMIVPLLQSPHMPGGFKRIPIVRNSQMRTCLQLMQLYPTDVICLFPKNQEGYMSKS